MAKPENIMKVAHALMRAEDRARSVPRSDFSSPGRTKGGAVVLLTASGAAERWNWSEKPSADVLARPEDDAEALKLAAGINTKIGQGEKAISKLKDGSVISRQSLNPSASAYKAGPDVAFCVHSHPEVSGENDGRLGFGIGDHAPLLKGTPNYVLNHKRDLYVLEYTQDGGYQERFIGNVPLGGRR